MHRHTKRLLVRDGYQSVCFEVFTMRIERHLLGTAPPSRVCSSLFSVSLVRLAALTPLVCRTIWSDLVRYSQCRAIVT